MAQANPQANQAMVQKVLAVFGKLDLPTLQQFYQMASQCLQNPQQYPALLQKVIATGKVKQGELPAQYDEKVVKSIAVALQIAISQKQGGAGASAPQPQGAGQPPLQIPKSL